MTYNPEYYKTHKDIFNKANKKWRENNTDKYRQLSQDWQKQSIKNNPAIYKINSKKWRTQNPDKYRNSILKNRFGITLKDYEDLEKKQNNVCAICQQPEKRSRKNVVSKLQVDHCHATGKIRGLLCWQCNTMLGKAKDNVEILKNAIKYLKSV